MTIFGTLLRRPLVETPKYYQDKYNSTNFHVLSCILVFGMPELSTRISRSQSVTVHPRYGREIFAILSDRASAAFPALSRRNLKFDVNFGIRTCFKHVGALQPVWNRTFICELLQYVTPCCPRLNILDFPQGLYHHFAAAFGSSGDGPAVLAAVAIQIRTTAMLKNFILPRSDGSYVRGFMVDETPDLEILNFQVPFVFFVTDLTMEIGAVKST